MVSAAWAGILGLYGQAGLSGAAVGTRGPLRLYCGVLDLEYPLAVSIVRAALSDPRSPQSAPRAWASVLSEKPTTAAGYGVAPLAPALTLGSKEAGIQQ